MTETNKVIDKLWEELEGYFDVYYSGVGSETIEKLIEAVRADEAEFWWHGSNAGALIRNKQINECVKQIKGYKGNHSNLYARIVGNMKVDLKPLEKIQREKINALKR